MKNKPDWIIVAAALSLGYVAFLMFTSETIVFPALLGAIVLNYMVGRIARRSYRFR